MGVRRVPFGMNLVPPEGIWYLLMELNCSSTVEIRYLLNVFATAWTYLVPFGTSLVLPDGIWYLRVVVESFQYLRKSTFRVYLVPPEGIWYRLDVSSTFWDLLSTSWWYLVPSGGTWTVPVPSKKYISGIFGTAWTYLVPFGTSLVLPDGIWYLLVVLGQQKSTFRVHLLPPGCI